LEEKNLKNFTSKSTLLTLLAISLVSILAIGCGDSKEFVATGTANQGTPATVGNLSFSFAKAVNAQTTGTVPSGTTTLRFDFFSVDPPASSGLVTTVTRAFATEITIEDVPTNVVTVLVTALDANGFPLATLQGEANVVLGATTPVDLGDATPITFDALTVTPNPTYLVEGETQQLTFTGSFSNGTVASLPINSTTAGFAFSQAGIVSISDAGLVSFETGANNTTATCSYTVGGTTLSDDVFIGTFVFNVSATAQYDLDPSSTYTAGYSNLLQDDNNFDNIDVTSVCTYAIETPTSGVVVQPNGNIELNNAAPGSTFNVVVTYVDSAANRPASAVGEASGKTFQGTIPFTVADSF